MHSFPKHQCIVLGVFQVAVGVVALVAAIISNDGLDKSGYAAIIVRNVFYPCIMLYQTRFQLLTVYHDL